MSKQNKTQLNSWDNHWIRGNLSSPDKYYKKKAAHEFVKKIRNQNQVNGKMNIIDLGCGNGGQLLQLREAFCDLRYVGIDISSKALDAVKRKTKNYRDKDNIILVNDNSCKPRLFS